MGLSMANMPQVIQPVEADDGQLAQSQSSNSSQSLLRLGDEKEKIEAELSALGNVLDSNKVTMSSTLTTIDGFPRADIDVALIRSTRARIIHLRNDYKALMTRIEQALHDRHAEYQADLAAGRASNALPGKESANANATQDPSGSAHGQISASSTGPIKPITVAHDSTIADTPFARVHSVASDSPAENAGLKMGDHIRRVGDINWTNHENLSRVGDFIRLHEGKPVSIKVLRKEIDRATAQDLDLILTPRAGWGGRGSLGCHLMPL